MTNQEVSLLLTSYIELVTEIFENDPELVSYKVYDTYLDTLLKWRSKGIEGNGQTLELEIMAWLDSLPFKE